MLAVKKRDDFMENRFSDTYNCTCGLPAPLTYKSITTKYNDMYITVHNVPVYECTDHHVKLSRLTRVKMTQKLKEAFSKLDDETSF